LRIIKNKFDTTDSAGPVAIATFAIIVNPALLLTDRLSDTV